MWSGHGRDVRTWTFLPNAAQDRLVRYAVQPQDWIAVLRAVSSRGEIPLALVHSHPTTPAVPSDYDQSHWHYPDLWCVIFSFAGETPQCNAYKFGK
ncbi:JAB domain-containing protein similar to deubiquitination enzymes [Tumebacillus permanentifrigoris]|uniref:JAB domain-containing protein similar to deubiquitination enzymes n=1 Tax=Tumebacillus permanentifrigoris TaxID=378543 RepID=A0A316D3N6_9BACL|nr:JAB domain-containing protein similar to deubiquitination enzymes [Tumebacillus permanentifrigoris]